MIEQEEMLLSSITETKSVNTNNKARLSVQRVQRYPVHVNRILSWLLAGMPAVEKFSFGHGKASMTRKHEKLYSYPSLPGIVHDDGQVMWPHTLKHLSLSCFSLGTNTFAANTELPSLETLQLTECGGNVDTIINGLRSTHPNVEATKIEKSSRWG